MYESASSTRNIITVRPHKNKQAPLYAPHIFTTDIYYKACA